MARKVLAKTRTSWHGRGTSGPTCGEPLKAVSSYSVGPLDGYFLMIVSASAKVRSDTSTLPLISHRRVVQGTIKKLTEDVHEFQFTVQLDGAIGEPFALDKGRHVLSGGGDGPEEVAIGDTLRGSARTQLRVAALDLGLRHIHQPIVQVLVDFASAGLEFVWWDFSQIATAR